MRDYHEAPRLTSDGPDRRVTFRELWAFVLVVVAGTVAGYCVECVDVLQALADTFPWNRDV